MKKLSIVLGILAMAVFLLGGCATTDYRGPDLNDIYVGGPDGGSSGSAAGLTGGSTGGTTGGSTAGSSAAEASAADRDSPGRPRPTRRRLPPAAPPAPRRSSCPSPS